MGRPDRTVGGVLEHYPEGRTGICLKATRNIYNGEEIFVDYGKAYWSDTTQHRTFPVRYGGKRWKAARRYITGE